MCVLALDHVTKNYKYKIYNKTTQKKNQISENIRNEIL